MPGTTQGAGSRDGRNLSFALISVFVRLDAALGIIASVVSSPAAGHTVVVLRRSWNSLPGNPALAQADSQAVSIRLSGFPFFR
jgi:hypothetical protein